MISRGPISDVIEAWIGRNPGRWGADLLELVHSLIDVTIQAALEAHKREIEFVRETYETKLELVQAELARAQLAAPVETATPRG